MSLYEDRRDERVTTLAITPSYTSDIAVKSISGKGAFAGYEIAAYVAAQVLYSVRGLPNDTLEIEAPDKIYTVTKDEKNGKVFVNLPKCKQLYSNRCENVDGIDLKTSALSYKNRIYKLVRCARAEHFADTSLRALLRSGLGDSIDGVGAYSYGGGELYMRYLLAEASSVTDFRILLAAASDVLERDFSADCLTVRCDKLTLSVRRMGDSLSVCDEKCEIYTLGAPDNYFK